MQTVEQQAANRALWVAALRSGKYKQARHRLCRDSDGEKAFCCLGVACEVAIENGVQVRKALDERKGMMAYNGEATTLPTVVRDWLGLTHVCGCIVGDDPNYLTAANDAYGWDFNKIADAIESGRVWVES